MENCCKEQFKKNPRSEEDIQNLKNRLNRISGQINGVTKMLDENRYCGDILIQIAAIEKGLEAVGYLILENHMKTCVKDDILSGDDKTIDEALDLMKKLK